ncbi:MAG: T9SS C-terminal target domain-containing protein [Flavobacterium sp.]|nr:MAG: T9SS C-terminal target domain-containing protein [Flavobacterium sp.]
MFLIICFCCISQVKTQNPDPDLFDQAWYLRSVYDTDQGQYLIVVEDYQPYGGSPTIPQINPWVTIDPTLAFNGVGICNTFDGMLEYNSSINSFRTIATNQTTNSCGFYENMDEPITIGPFRYVDPDPNFFTVVDPQITDDPDGYQTLTYITQPFINYTYRNTPVLGTEDLTRLTISIYPNPTDEFIHIRTANVSMQSVTVKDLNGRKIIQKQPGSDELTLEIGSLNSGMYFLEIDSDNGRSVKKIIRK